MYTTNKDLIEQIAGKGAIEQLEAAVIRQNGKKRIYIAGKVTGENINECSEKFMRVEVALERQGYAVSNPLKIVADPSCDWKEAMRKCLMVMLTCHAVYMLPCWAKSRGAILERYLAGHLGIEIIDAEN